MAVTSFNFSGANWSDPDPEDKRYWDALRQATVYKAAMAGVKVNFPPLDENKGLIVRNPQTIIDAIKTFVGNYYDSNPRYYYGRFDGVSYVSEVTEEYWYSDMFYRSETLGHQSSAWIAGFHTKLSWSTACHKTYLLCGGGSNILGGLKPDAIFNVEKTLITFLYTMLNKILYIHKSFSIVWRFSYELIELGTRVRMTYFDYGVDGEEDGCPAPELLSKNEIVSRYPDRTDYCIDMFSVDCYSWLPECASGATIVPRELGNDIPLGTESTDHGVFTNLDCICDIEGDGFFSPEYAGTWEPTPWAATRYKEGHQRLTCIFCYANEYPPPDTAHMFRHRAYYKKYGKMQLAYASSSEVSIHGLTAYGISEDLVPCTRKVSVKPCIYDLQEINFSGTCPIQTQYLSNIELVSNGSTIVDLSNRPDMPDMPDVDAKAFSYRDGNCLIAGLVRYTTISMSKHNINIAEDLVTYVGNCATTTLFTNED